MQQPTAQKPRDAAAYSAWALIAGLATALLVTSLNSCISRLTRPPATWSELWSTSWSTPGALLSASLALWAAQSLLGTFGPAGDTPQTALGRYVRLAVPLMLAWTLVRLALAADGCMWSCALAAGTIKLAWSQVQRRRYLSQHCRLFRGLLAALQLGDTAAAADAREALASFDRRWGDAPPAGVHDHGGKQH